MRPNPHKSRANDRRYPLRPFADRLPAHRRRPTALFNWLYAKHTGGKFLLRIEDTDRARSTEPAIAAILDGLSWLGLEWDGDVTYQFARAARHAEVANKMLARQ